MNPDHPKIESPMTPEEQQARWNRIKEVFGQAIERNPELRRAFILGRFRDDQGMCEEALALLDAYECRQEFAEHPVFGYALRALFAQHARGHIGEKIGGYRIEREIGSGGMGAVYLGVRDDEAFEKKVAVKIVNEYAADPEYLNRRLCAERAILAKLDHPNIARLLDGGTTEAGLPYFIMEFVAGTPISTYCEEHKLTVRQKLTLFQGVCAAIHYSHRNLIVHRDVKPGNILVDEAGIPKLLDFGIAKLLAEDPGRGKPRTTTVHRVMTPLYASPEQVRGEPVTTASDVYSLGVVLYELLTGRFPYRFEEESAAEVERVIRHAEPVRPSEAVLSDDDENVRPAAVRLRLSRELAGDLDAILLYALRKEPDRRYGSAERLSEDIQRYLDGLPVAARADSYRYRAGKFLRRYRVAVAAGLVAAFSLGTATGVSIYQSRVAGEERRRAELRFEETWQLAKSNVFELHDAIERLPGSTAARGLLVRQTLGYLDRLDREAGNDPVFKRELGMAYVRVGEVQGRPYTANLGDVEGALASYRKGVTHLEAALAEKPEEPEFQRDASIGYERLGELAAYRMHDFKLAGHNFDRALALRRRLVERAPGNPEYVFLLGSISIGEGDLLNMRGDAVGALNWFDQAVGILELLSREAANPGHRRKYAAALQRKVYCLRGLADAAAGWGRKDWANDFLQLALEHHQSAFRIRSELAEADPGNAGLRRSVADSLVDASELNGRLGRIAPARAGFQEAFSRFQKLAESDPTNRELLIDTLSLLARYEATEKAAGNFRECLPICHRAEAIFAKLPALSGANRELTEWRLWYEAEVAETSLALGDSAAALSANRRLEALLVVDRSGEPVLGQLSEVAKRYRKLGDDRAFRRVRTELEHRLGAVVLTGSPPEILSDAALVLTDPDLPELTDHAKGLGLVRALGGAADGNLPALIVVLRRAGRKDEADRLVETGLKKIRLSGVVSERPDFNP